MKCGRCKEKIEEGTNDVFGESDMVCPFCERCYRELLGNEAVDDIQEWC